MTSISIIIPAYNEEDTIISVLQEIKKYLGPLNISAEVIVVDDCSSDKTLELLKSNHLLYDQLIHHEKNLGKGGAVISGINAANHEYILIQDADLEYSPKDYEKLLFPITNFGSDIVMGSRFLAPPCTRVVYFWHKVGNKLITFLFNIINNTTFTDIYSGYLVFRKSLLNKQELKKFGWDQQAEILSIICKNAKVIYEVPITYRGRTYSEGKKIRAIDIIPVITTIIIGRF